MPANVISGTGCPEGRCGISILEDIQTLLGKSLNNMNLIGLE